MKDYWYIPPKENAEFVGTMEDRLDIYELPYNLEIPVMYMDEKPYQCLYKIWKPLPLRPRDNTKIDSEYICESMYSIFAEPLRDGATTASGKNGQPWLGGGHQISVDGMLSGASEDPLSP